MEVAGALAWDDAAKDDGAGEDRLLGSDELLADRRTDAVRGDDAVGGDTLAALQRDAVVACLDDARTEPEHAGRERIDEHTVQIRAEEVELRGAEMLLGRVAVVGMEEQRAVVPAQQVDSLRA